jgi:hypothetical protein
VNQSFHRSKADPIRYLIDALAAAGCLSLVFVAACSGSSPTAAAGGPNDNHVFGLVSDGVRQPLAGATVRVVDSPMAGTTLTSGPDGRFQLYSTSRGTVTVQVAHAGFKPATRTLQWQAAVQGGIDVIRLESLESSETLLEPGAYTVTFSMDPAAARDFGTLPACAGFPAELMSRSYNATIAQSSHTGADRALSLDGLTVFSNSEFDLLIGGQFVGFEIESPFTAVLPGFRYLNIIGHAPTDQQPATVSGAAVTVPFSALFQYCELKSPATRGWENCQHVAADQIVQFNACGSSARMVFTRR